MDNTYWKGRWQRGETGWHQNEVEPALVEQFSKIKPTRVFVPLCGKSLDMSWLAAQGHEVIGVEFTALACEAFFAENNLKYERRVEGEFTVYRSTGVTIFNGDFFNLGPTQLGKIGAIYDRAALIATPPESRLRYANHVLELVRSCSVKSEFHFLEIVLERAPHDQKGPPFSVPRDELEQLYGRDFKIDLLSREHFDVGDECVYRFVKSWAAAEQPVKPSGTLTAKPRR